MAKAISIKLLAAAGIFAALWFGQAPLSWLIAGIIALAALALIGWGVFNVNSSLWARTLWRGLSDNTVALTFDDGPDERFTARVLEILRGKDVKAAFFVVGSRAQKSPALLQRIKAEGHLVGNHSFTHAWNINFGLWGRLRREIAGCNDVVESAIGQTPRFYRAPHGFKNPALGDVLDRAGMVAVGWQIRGFDAVRGDAAAIARRVVEGAQAGGVILLHDGGGLQGTDDRGATLEALPVIIDGLRARGFKLARLDDLLGEGAYAARLAPQVTVGAT
ncbi:MAG: polysaccharide deacetylase family protein [Planctomycetes bacterium]|nr:polysaccharide deacetylase family protein [Planctomycetota bacterium]